jgi:hypothetical protein
MKNDAESILELDTCEYPAKNIIPETLFKPSSEEEEVKSFVEP